jgi:N-methylhydantoinase B/oxoprolinase/acetone carboxylase alpha subunit
LSIGRVFRIREGMTFSIRAEAFRVQPHGLRGARFGEPGRDHHARCGRNLTGGFGFINQNNNGQPRNGQLVGRFTF